MQEKPSKQPRILTPYLTPIIARKCTVLHCKTRFFKPNSNKSKTPQTLEITGFAGFFRLARPEGLSRCGYALRLASLRQSRSDFVPKNSPPDCFFNATHPLRVRVPRVKKRTSTFRLTLIFSGPPGGTRTPSLWNRNPLRYPISPRADF